MEYLSRTERCGDYQQQDWLSIDTECINAIIITMSLSLKLGRIGKTPVTTEREIRHVPLVEVQGMAAKSALLGFTQHPPFTPEVASSVIVLPDEKPLENWTLVQKRGDNNYTVTLTKTQYR